MDQNKLVIDRQMHQVDQRMIQIQDTAKSYKDLKDTVWNKTSSTTASAGNRCTETSNDQLGKVVTRISWTLIWCKYVLSVVLRQSTTTNRIANVGVSKRPASKKSKFQRSIEKSHGSYTRDNLKPEHFKGWIADAKATNLAGTGAQLLSNIAQADGWKWQLCGDFATAIWKAHWRELRYRWQVSSCLPSSLSSVLNLLHNWLVWNSILGYKGAQWRILRRIARESVNRSHSYCVAYTNFLPSLGSKMLSTGRKILLQILRPLI